MSHIKSLKWSYEVDVEADGIQLVRPGSLRVTTPWYELIVLPEGFLEGLDPDNFKLSGDILSIKVANGEASYWLKRDLSGGGVWIGTLLEGSKGGALYTAD